MSASETPNPNPESSPPGVEIAPSVRAPDSALRFSFTRSSGPGGQNVNKVNTQAELRIAVEDLTPPTGTLPKYAAARLRKIAGKRLTKEDEILITSGEHRTQRRNRQECLDRLRQLLVEALHRSKKRTSTKPTKASKRRRIKEKKQRGETKRLRKPPKGDESR